MKAGDLGLNDAEALAPPAVLDPPRNLSGDLAAAVAHSFLAEPDGSFGALDIVFEPADPLEHGGLVVAASAAELGEAAEVGQLPPGVRQPPDRFLPVLEGVGELPLGVAKVPETLRRAGGQDRLMFGPFGAQLGEPAERVVHGEASVRDASQSVEDFLVGGVLVSEDAAVVYVGEARVPARSRR